MSKTNCTPYTNRGVLNNEEHYKNHSSRGSNDIDINHSCQAKKDIIIDWFEFTIKDKKIKDILNDFNLNIEDVMHVKSGLFGYTDTLVYKEKMKFMYNEKDLKNIEEYHRLNQWIQEVKDSDIEQLHKLDFIGRYNERKLELKSIIERGMGIHILFSGYACREFEEEYDWYWLFKYAHSNASKISRIDIAIDVFDKNLLDIKKVRWFLRQGLIVAKAKLAVETNKREISTGNIVGQSINIGSRSSSTMIQFYDKLQERTSANYVVIPEIDHWNRCEIRLRDDSAKNFLSQVLEQSNDFAKVVMKILNNLMSIKDIKANQTIKSNKSLMKNVKWWDDFLQTTEKTKLSQKAIQSTIQQKEQWIHKSVVKTLAAVFLVDIVDIKYTDLPVFVKLGIEKIDSFTLEQINQERIRKGETIISIKELDIIKSVLNERLVEM